MEAENLSFDDLIEDKKVIYNRVTNPEYFQYKLSGIVIHIGTTDSGHYYSFIKEREGGESWFEFNDHVVNSFNPDNIPTEAFGGEDADYETKLSKYKHD
jgi:ubiquitin C-terminal hydrolase